jgi:hypothetical protein
MITVDGQWQEVSWRRAFERCTELLAPVIEKYRIGVDRHRLLVGTDRGEPGPELSSRTQCAFGREVFARRR